MSLTFYRAPMSTATVTEIVLAELGVPHETVTLDLRNGDAKKPEFLKLNPNGMVPLLVHDGTAIFESAAITIHLGETFGVDKGVWPKDRLGRAEAVTWVVWTSASLVDAVGRWQRNTSSQVPDDEKNAKAGAAGRALVDRYVGILDGALAGKTYLAGDYSLADAHLHSFVDWLRMIGVDTTPFTHVDTWAKRCASREAYQKVMGSHRG